jgi:putative ABC transport system permease protein
MNLEIFEAETWGLAWDALRGNKMRAALTMLGVVIGSACIVLVVTVALAGKKYIIGQIEGVGANIVYAGLVETSQTQSLNDEITGSDLEAVKQDAPHVVQVAGTYDMTTSVVVNGQQYPVNLVGVTEGFQEIRNLVIVRGRYFDSDDMRLTDKVCLLTKELTSLVFPAENPVGKDIRIGELHFTVIGVFEERVGTFGQSEITGKSLIVPFSLIKYYTGESYFKTFYAQADRPEDVPGVTLAVGRILRNRHRPEAQYLVQNLTGILDTARQIATALTVVLIVIALIALAISGVGIMNIMLVTVTERTREIGIRKAIGARRNTIRYQFLIEAILISGTGALAGILIAVSIPVLINFLVRFFPEVGDITVPVSWVSVVLAFVVSCSTGLVFGYLPANRAAKLHPIESLRHE